MSKTLAKNLLSQRRAAGLSLAALAEETGVAKSYLWTLENPGGTERRPSVRTMTAIAEALKVEITELMEEQGD